MLRGTDLLQVDGPKKSCIMALLPALSCKAHYPPTVCIGLSICTHSNVGVGVRMEGRAGFRRCWERG